MCTLAVLGNMTGRPGRPHLRRSAGKHIAEELLVDPLSLKYQSPGGDTFIGTRQFPSPGVSWDSIQARSAARAVCKV